MSDGKELELSQGNDIAPASDGAVEIAASQRMTMLHEALTNPDINPEKALAMAELMFKVEDRDLRAQFNRDKVAAINKMPQIFQDGQSHNAKYAKFESLHKRVRPILDQHNLTIRFDIDSQDNGQVAVTPILEHENGQNERGGTMVAPPDNGGKKSPVQAVASTASYLKRHSMKAMLNIIEGGEDDDGQGGKTREDFLRPDQRAIVDEARSNTMDGSAHYLEWFKGQSPAKKGWLVDEGYHDQNKKAADLVDNPPE